MGWTFHSPVGCPVFATGKDDDSEMRCDSGTHQRELLLSVSVCLLSHSQVGQGLISLWNVTVMHQVPVPATEAMEVGQALLKPLPSIVQSCRSLSSNVFFVFKCQHGFGNANMCRVPPNAPSLGLFSGFGNIAAVILLWTVWQGLGREWLLSLGVI